MTPLLVIYLAFVGSWLLGCGLMAWVFSDGYPKEARTAARLALAAPLWPVIVAYWLIKGSVNLVRTALPPKWRGYDSSRRSAGKGQR